MNRADRRAERARARRAGPSRERLRAALSAPSSPAIVSVDVPQALRPHLDDAIKLASRLQPEDLDGCELLAVCTGRETMLSIVPHLECIAMLRTMGEVELADLITEPIPGGRSRIVLVSPTHARVYGFRWGVLSPGGCA